MPARFVSKAGKRALALVATVLLWAACATPIEIPGDDKSSQPRADAGAGGHPDASVADSQAGPPDHALPPSPDASTALYDTMPPWAAADAAAAADADNPLPIDDGSPAHDAEPGDGMSLDGAPVDGGNDGSPASDATPPALDQTMSVETPLP